tara:strand:- start:12 stop:1103 length:1092 start_codon:yes stop_codon:yes gene_type:complete
MASPKLNLRRAWRNHPSLINTPKRLSGSLWELGEEEGNLRDLAKVLIEEGELHFRAEDTADLVDGVIGEVGDILRNLKSLRGTIVELATETMERLHEDVGNFTYEGIKPFEVQLVKYKEVPNEELGEVSRHQGREETPLPETPLAFGLQWRILVPFGDDFAKEGYEFSWREEADRQWEEEWEYNSEVFESTDEDEAREEWEGWGSTDSLKVDWYATRFIEEWRDARGKLLKLPGHTIAGAGEAMDEPVSLALKFGGELKDYAREQLSLAGLLEASVKETFTPYGQLASLAGVWMGPFDGLYSYEVFGGEGVPTFPAPKLGLRRMGPRARKAGGSNLLQRVASSGQAYTFPFLAEVWGFLDIRL